MDTAGGVSLDVRGMLIRNYRTGGIRLDTDGNQVRDTVFEQLGNQHVPDGPGYSASHLPGSSHNTIRDNVFRDLVGRIQAVWQNDLTSLLRFHQVP